MLDVGCPDSMESYAIVREVQVPEIKVITRRGSHKFIQTIQEMHLICHTILIRELFLGSIPLKYFIVT